MTTSTRTIATADEQRARLLPDFVAGRKLFCTGSTEPDTGSDPRGIRTRLTRSGGRLLLNGRKMWITNVSACDAILVTCLDAREGDRSGKVIKVVVERDRSPFDAREIADLIDGRAMPPVHGTREMPVWGRRFSARVGGGEVGEEAVRGQLLILVEYLRSIQR